MSKSKKGLSNKVITVFDPNTDEEFEIYVTYEWYNESVFSDDLFGDLSFSRENIDIKHFESIHGPYIPQVEHTNLHEKPHKQGPVMKLRESHAGDDDELLLPIISNQKDGRSSQCRCRRCIVRDTCAAFVHWQAAHASMWRVTCDV
jgi:hypothetical protein